MRVLVTGGAGYIGSHTLVELLTEGHEVLVIDNLSNGHEEALSRVKLLANKDFGFVKGDVRDSEALNKAFPSLAPRQLSILPVLRRLAKASSSRSPIMRTMSPVQSNS